MTQTKQKYFNIERGKLKNQLFYNFVKYAYAFFGLSFLIYYLNVSLLSLLMVAFSLCLIYIRFTRFPTMQDENDILALELSALNFVLDCGAGDYQISISKIEYFKFDFQESTKDYSILIRIKSTEQVEWPAELYQRYYLRLPNVFQEDLFYIINQNKSLMKLCQNYAKAASYLQYEKDLQALAD